ncbi:MAG TPA: hypothetical protein VGH29_17300, partial [Candidatus Binataceae bacterium]
MKITATAPRISLRRARAVAAALFALLTWSHLALAQNAPAPNARQSTGATSTTSAISAQSATIAPQSNNPIVEYFLDWFPRLTRIQSEQPHW